MNLPENQSTLRNIKIDTYENIRERFKSYATYWNAIWQIWLNKTPEWGKRAYGNFLHQEIPANERFTNKKEYDPNDSGEINPIIPNYESEIIETIGNHNIIREKVKEFNTTLAKNFTELEYKSTGTNPYTTTVKSYGVEYITENNGKITSREHYFVKEYETFSQDYRYGSHMEGDTEVWVYTDENGNVINRNRIPKINLYEDENLSTLKKNVYISLRKGLKKNYVVWTGERFYKTNPNDPYYVKKGDPYEAPTNLTSNESKGLSVSNNSLGTNTYKLFNGTNSTAFKTNNTITELNPEIIYFNLEKSLRITNYSIYSDATYNCYPTSWKLEGSDDKENWKTVNIQSDIIFNKNTKKTFNVSDDRYFLFWRLAITSFKEASKKYKRMKQFTFNGEISYTDVNIDNVLPNNLGVEYDGDMSGIKTYSQSISSNDYQHFSKFNSTHVENTNYDNLEKLKLYDRSTAKTLNNIENEVRQDNIVRKDDLDQIQRVLDKINSVLKLRDGWFDRNGRCSVNCQIQCQSGCQVNCQNCNTKQCHNQKCGMH